MNDDDVINIKSFLGLESLHGRIDDNRRLDDNRILIDFKDGILFIRGFRAKKELYIGNYWENRFGLKDFIGIELMEFVAEKSVFIGSGLRLIVLKSCTFESKLHINKWSFNNSPEMKLKNFSITESSCEGSFKLHNCDIELFEIIDTNFHANADFFKSKVTSGIKNIISGENEEKTIQFKAISFEKMALFGEVVFRSSVVFKDVTFMGNAQFRDATFMKGVDLDYTNIEGKINFYGTQELDTDISIQHTPQETYRIIKYQLRAIGNTIDSNKYHSLELEKKRRNTPIFSLEYPVFLLHRLSSKHSQNWLLPILWIFIVGIITTFSLDSLCRSTERSFITQIFDYISIVSINDCIKNNPIVFLLNKVSLGYLYYQFLTAVRKDTKT